MPAPRRQALPISLLVAVTAVWGSTFVIIKGALATMAPLDFLAWRFGIATLVMLAVRPRSLLALDRRGTRRGVILGLVLAGGYICQTLGLEHTTAAVSGFVTGMFVVFTPLLTGLLLRRRIPLPALAATVLAAVGLGLISLHGFFLGEGVALTLGCALFFALQIVALGEWAGSHDAYALCVLQLGTTAVCCTALSAVMTLRPPPSAGVWAAVVMTAVLATALAFAIQTWAQALISPTRAAIVLTMEPVFAALAAAIAGEALGWRVVLGGSLVLAAMYLVELPLPRGATGSAASGAAQ